MSNLQYLPKASIISNSQIPQKHYKQKENEKLIHLSHEDQKHIQLNHNNIIHLQPHLAHKESFQNKSATYSSFDKAIIESRKTDEYFKHKRQVTEGKREIIEGIVRDRDRKIKENLENEKQQLKSVLTRIIKDSLKFTKECTPMISMMPSKLNKAIEQIKSEKKLQNNSISLDSVNLSSYTANNQNKKYESNAFLKELGLDLNNLTPDTINIDIDKAYDFVKKWKINRDDINEVIRMKVVNEIMNVEERRSVWRIKNVEQKIQKYNSSVPKREKIVHKENEGNISEKKILVKNNTEINYKRENTKIIKSNNYLPKKSVSKSMKSFESFKKKENHECLKNLYGSEKVRSLTHFEKKRIREKCVLCWNQEIFQKSFKLNAYRNVDKIVRYINSNESLRSNENLSRHFNSIKFNKKFDDVTKRLVSEYSESLQNFNMTQEVI